MVHWHESRQARICLDSHDRPAPIVQQPRSVAGSVPRHENYPVTRLSVIPLCLVVCVITACSPSEEKQPQDQAPRPQASGQQESSKETVYVKYRGPVSLAPFNCEWVTRSSVVERLCYDSKEQYVIVSLGGTYYHYCEVPPEIVSEWRDADSMGRYYNAQIKGRFDCRVNRMPTYPRHWD